MYHASFLHALNPRHEDRADQVPQSADEQPQQKPVPPVAPADEPKLPAKKPLTLAGGDDY